MSAVQQVGLGKLEDETRWERSLEHHTCCNVVEECAVRRAPTGFLRVLIGIDAVREGLYRIRCSICIDYMGCAGGKRVNICFLCFLLGGDY